jgi:tetratricopeptide (TPR) repeat protein
MTMGKRVSLGGVRTDGWLERIAEGTPSYRSICDVLGESFFAFSIIVGARITSLDVDRRNADHTIVEFALGANEASGEGEPQRLTLPDFRRRLVIALISQHEEPSKSVPSESDVDATQDFIGVRFVLLAPIFGYRLEELVLDEGAPSKIRITGPSGVETVPLDAFRTRLRGHVREELEHASNNQQGAIDLARVDDVEVAASRGDWSSVVATVGSWAGPLSVFVRTPEGQMLPMEARTLLARALAILGTAYVRLGQRELADEVFRVAIQYAPEGASSADCFLRFGSALVDDGRHAEAIALLRRAQGYGAPAAAVLPILARAFAERGRFVAAQGCLDRAAALGLPATELAATQAAVDKAIGPAASVWRSHVRSGGKSASNG